MNNNQLWSTKQLAGRIQRAKQLSCRKRRSFDGLAPYYRGLLGFETADFIVSREMAAKANLAIESRVDRRKRRNRLALIEAANKIMTEKGIDAATMLEIAELADVGAGTVYNYFESKDELAVCVLEQVMHRLAERIEAVTDTFSDPAQVYAFGVRNVMRAATSDQRWRWLLKRSEVIAGAMYRVMGPYAIRDIRRACKAGRYSVEDPELAWRQATHAIVGFSIAVCDQDVEPEKINEAVVNLLGMVGVRRDEAWEIAQRPCPELPKE